MMQPTPAPSSPPKSPKQSPEHETPRGSDYPPPPPNTGSAPFGVLSGLFEKLQTERKHERRKKLLGAWFNHWREEKGLDLFPVLRLILPQRDRERTVYGLKEKNLAKIYIKLIPLGMKDPDAIRLLNWKKPAEKDKASGDFPSVLYEVVSKRSSVVEGDLTIHELNDILDELAGKIGKQAEQSRILQRIYNRTTPEEQRWIVRIILKDMNISVKETTVFSVFHPEAQDLYNTCSDLKKVAWTLWDPSFRLKADDKTVQLFEAFTPMLCKRPTRTIEQTVKEMGGAEFLIEEKLDGERMQIHKRGNEYFYSSRKGKDYTYLYGKHVGSGTLTPYLDKAFDERVEEIILDGEMLVWDPVSQRNLPFGSLKTAALDRSKKEHNPRPCFKVFDLLYLNGQSLLEKSTVFRKRNMRACLKEVPGRVEFAVEYRGKTAQDIRQRMEEVMSTRGEGLVIKHPLSKYVLNGRNMDWIKVKPEYMDNMGETVDVLVVAGNYGTGSRGGGVSTLVCAVLDDRRQQDEFEDPKYNSFVRIGSGLSFADYVWIRSKPWKTWDPKNPPDFFLTAKKGREDKGDMYLEPEDSFIIKIKAAEIVSSDLYNLGYTMRFPRAIMIRDDLSVADCMTASELMEHIRSEKKRKAEMDVSVKNPKKRKTTAKKATMFVDYDGPNLTDVAKESNIFKDMVFAVIADPKSRNGKDEKQEIMRLIAANGGSCVQVARKPGTMVVYDGRTTPYDIKMIVDKGVLDIIKPKWITDSVAEGSQVPLTKRYFFHATESRRQSENYNADASDSEQEPRQDAGSTASEDEQDNDPQDAQNEDVPAKTEESDKHSEWFKVERDERPNLGADDDTEDDDSENDDVVNEDADAPDEDDWVNVPEQGSQVESTLKDDEQETSQPNNDVTMGEDDSAMEYDQDLIFKHLCFYLDTPSNARANKMTVKSKYEQVIEQSFVDLRKTIETNGGRVVSLDEPKLTHVVVDKRDDSRRIELMKRTSQPKRRHLVISEFIQACLDENTLLDEDEFAP